MAVENRGGMRPTAPQNNPNNISLTGGDGQNPRKPELEYRGLGYRTEQVKQMLRQKLHQLKLSQQLVVLIC
jgi:hypothetical protein